MLRSPLSMNIWPRLSSKQSRDWFMEENSEAKVGVDNKKDKSENKLCNKLDDSSNKKENLWAVDTDDSFTLNIDFRGGSRAAATSKTEHFVIIVNGFYKALHRKCCSSPRSASGSGDRGKEWDCNYRRLNKKKQTKKQKKQVDEAIKLIRPKKITKTESLLNAASMQSDRQLGLKSPNRVRKNEFW